MFNFIITTVYKLFLRILENLLLLKYIWNQHNCSLKVKWPIVRQTMKPNVSSQQKQITIIGIMLQKNSVTTTITNNMSIWSSFKTALVWWGQQWPQRCHGSLLKSSIAGRQNSHYCPKAATKYPCHHWDACSPTKWVASGSYSKPARANISPLCQTAAIKLRRVE